MPTLEPVDRIQFTVETLIVRDGQKLQRPRPNADGYYENFPMAALGVATRNNTYYDVDEFVKQITSPATFFNKMLSDGTLYGEYGHPDLTGMTHEQQLSRLSITDEDRVSHHFRKVGSGEKLSSGGRLITAEIKPHGPFGRHLKESLDEPFVNTAFSLRSITHDRQEGQLLRRKMAKLVTFDAVAAGGYSEASKRYVAHAGAQEMIQIQIDPKKDMATISRVAFESYTDTELAEIFKTDDIAQVTRELTILRGTGLLKDGEGRVKSLYHEIVRA